MTLYDEALDDAVLRAARARMFSADMLLIGGTSLIAQPAGSLPELFMGKRLAIINYKETPFDEEAQLVIRASLGETLDAAIAGDSADKPCLPAG